MHNISNEYAEYIYNIVSENFTLKHCEINNLIKKDCKYLIIYDNEDILKLFKGKKIKLSDCFVFNVNLDREGIKQYSIINIYKKFKNKIKYFKSEPILFLKYSLNFIINIIWRIIGRFLKRDELKKTN